MILNTDTQKTYSCGEMSVDTAVAKKNHSNYKFNCKFLKKIFTL